MKTLTFTVNAVGDPESITVQSVCKRVTFGEDQSVGGWPTTDFNVRFPSMTDDPRRVGVGETYTLYRESFFQPGETIAYVDVPAGSTTFFQDEGQ